MYIYLKQEPVKTIPNTGSKAIVCLESLNTEINYSS